MNFGYVPHWDADRQSLYVTNATVSLIRYDAATNQLYEGTFSDTNFKVDVFFPTDDENRFVAAFGMNVYILEWDGFNSNVTVVEKIGTLQGIQDLTYVNTGKVDPKNRLLLATWRYDRCNPKGNSPDGSVFILEGGKPVPIIGGVRYPSGLEWDVTASKMYFVDICKLNIMAYDWCEKDGTVSNGKIIYVFRVDFPINSDLAHYLPVYLSLNSNGNLMVALFNESTIAEINPT